MKIQYFEDTDTALFEVRPGPIAETREHSEDIYLDLDAAGEVVSITIEHASGKSDLPDLSYFSKLGRLDDLSEEIRKTEMELHQLRTLEQLGTRFASLAR